MKIRLFYSITASIVGLCCLFLNQSHAQTNWSERMADTMLEVHKDSITYKEENKHSRWDYEQGLLLKAIERVWYRTGDAKYFRFILKDIDGFVSENGEIKGYKLEQYNIDNITGGRLLIMLYRETGKEKFK
jgi:unsaturated rhamnogalacturonyl hydrolase